MQQHLPAHSRHIPRRGQMPFTVQPAGVFKVGPVHAKGRGLLVHHRDKRALASAHILGHRHCGVVGAGYTDRLEHVVQRHLLAGFQPDLTAAHAVGMFRHRHRILPADLAGLHRFKGQQQRHHLGDGSDRPLFVGILLIQHRTGILIHQDGGLAGQIESLIVRRFHRKGPG